jgi:hypothetical protein
MDLLFKHLGINTPPDLKQGQSFNHGIRQFSFEPTYNLLQEGSPSSLISSIETMQPKDNNAITTLSKLDVQFKQLLSEYTSLLNTVNREILHEQAKYGSMADYLGKRITTNDSDTYINEYGYARDIPLSSMVDSSCPQSSDTFNNSCQELSDAYGATYAKDYNAICKKAYPAYNTVIAVKTPCVAGGCNEALGYESMDMCELPSGSGWSCCASEWQDPKTKNLHLGIDDPDATAQIEKNRGNESTDATNFGCAPDFAKEWWKQHSCDTKPTSSEHPGCAMATMNTDNFKKGPEMNPGEPCNLSGKNIRNSTTDEVAWVDTTGTKHIYPNLKMRDNLIGCKNKVTVTLDEAKYTIVPTGSPMTEDSICLNISVNESDYIKLLNMNKQLQVLAANIVKQLDALISKDSETEEDIRSKKSSIRGFLKNLKAERKNFDQNQQLLKTMKYQSEDSHISYVSNKYHMIAWGLLVVGVGGFTIHQLTTRRSL